MISSDHLSIGISREHELAYSVRFVNGIFAEGEVNALTEYCDRQLFIVVDKNVYEIYGKEIDMFFTAHAENFKIHIYDAKEDTKNIDAVLDICKIARSFHFQRDGYFIGIGGGITLDVVGFAASMFRRKSNYIRIPTTLIGLVDAGVGVKVGVNFDGSKNLIGAYHPPVISFNDQIFLRTVGITEIRGGLYEIVKMALCDSEELFELLEDNFEKFLDKSFDEETLRINFLASELMMRRLEPNLFESNLRRKVDFGHTFSPHIEESNHYQIQHGEAVGVDILISSHISHKKGLIKNNEFKRINELIFSIGGVSHFDRINTKSLYASLDAIRAHRAGNLNLVVPKGIGECTFIQKCEESEIEEAVEFYLLQISNQ
jgi:2-epi-5-epi-valiolone synthase